MKNRITLFLFFLIASTSCVFAQKSNYYLEDQIFISPTYNLIVNKSDSISQGGFSNGFVVGYIRDIPLNERRNFGLGIGINYSISHTYQNIRIASDEFGDTEMDRLYTDEYIRNKFSVSYIEMPFEIRYRTSTIDDHTFFRAYLGFKLGYKLRQYSKIKTRINEIAYYNQSEFNWWRYALTLNVGYGTWNLFVMYSLSEVFKDDVYADPISPESELIPMNMNELTIGLTFYLI
ncbi:MAG: PorT family protein [Flavobacteriales bacterium]|nr:PorT family protein [Flavobacteriales bacterium]